MDQPLFFIDTNPDDEIKETIVVAPENVLGKEDPAIAEKRRKKKEMERNLSKFLFGAISADEGVDVGKDKEASEESDSDDSEGTSSDESVEDLDDVDIDNEVGDEDKEDVEIEEFEAQVDSEAGSEVNEDKEDIDGTDNTDSESDTENDAEKLPEDIYGNNLYLRGKKRKAAWKDDADEKVLVKDVAANFKKGLGKHGSKDESSEKYGKAVERKFISLVGEPSWAKLDQDAEQDSDEEFFRETTDLLDKGRVGDLKREIIEFRKLKDMNNETYNEGTVIRSTEFHPTSTVGLVAGLSGTASIFQVDGKFNPKIQTINFKDFPIKTAKFSVDGNEVIAGSQFHTYFYVYDMIAGKVIKIKSPRQIEEFSSQRFDISPDGKIIAFKGRFGSIHLVSARTKEYIRSIKMNDECQALKFSKSGAQLYTHGEGGEVYVWDTRSSLCVNKFVDDGCIAGSALAVNSSYLATGSSEGVVNIYNLAKIDKPNPSPDKVILNLTTQINQLRFNPTGEILALSSELKDTAIKLVHFPSKTVFSNFPGTLNLNKINSVDFSPGGGYLSLGNNKGAALLYRLKHYKDY
ncbi:U3 small nucleolar RNA-associated protein 18 homolog isoform X2 [Eurytemora carolleeae]|uniref:U3 small nucleolar RNA-associated protein 18 homolog isoform X2 n=1 Tax=Eurytemora carolleeae TaxID=1294199 RepID=UPI000C765D95|nr:U3 small nucleolar RNA-associated protein 18 homolog isoform X2 [Eurytemora carolleeae]|eukprot:XP_023341141.1 U3 small nucleolar RNA-associated protein 18 homolog isoform X2 [Eurytemora affinis]